MPINADANQPNPETPKVALGVIESPLVDDSGRLKLQEVLTSLPDEVSTGFGKFPQVLNILDTYIKGLGDKHPLVGQSLTEQQIESLLSQPQIYDPVEGGPIEVIELDDGTNEVIWVGTSDTMRLVGYAMQQVDDWLNTLPGAMTQTLKDALARGETLIEAGGAAGVAAAGVIGMVRLIDGLPPSMRRRVYRWVAELTIASLLLSACGPLSPSIIDNTDFNIPKVEATAKGAGGQGIVDPNLSAVDKLATQQAQSASGIEGVLPTPGGGEVAVPESAVPTLVATVDAPAVINQEVRGEATRLKIVESVDPSGIVSQQEAITKSLKLGPGDGLEMAAFGFANEEQTVHIVMPIFTVRHSDGSISQWLGVGMDNFGKAGPLFPGGEVKMLLPLITEVRNGNDMLSIDLGNSGTIPFLIINGQNGEVTFQSFLRDYPGEVKLSPLEFLKGHKILAKLLIPDDVGEKLDQAGEGARLYKDVSGNWVVEAAVIGPVVEIAANIQEGTIEYEQALDLRIKILDPNIPVQIHRNTSEMWKYVEPVPMEMRTVLVELERDINGNYIPTAKDIVTGDYYAPYLNDKGDIAGFEVVGKMFDHDGTELVPGVMKLVYREIPTVKFVLDELGANDISDRLDYFLPRKDRVSNYLVVGLRSGLIQSRPIVWYVATEQNRGAFRDETNAQAIILRDILGWTHGTPMVVNDISGKYMSKVAGMTKGEWVQTVDDYFERHKKKLPDSFTQSEQGIISKALKDGYDLPLGELATMYWFIAVKDGRFDLSTERGSYQFVDTVYLTRDRLNSDTVFIVLPHELFHAWLREFHGYSVYEEFIAYLKAIYPLLARYNPSDAKLVLDVVLGLNPEPWHFENK
ncbi:hypothetical protein A2W24_00710 [Microgenomates group bacterium RBG_16_45_19]|nr:MAG: hypothetical protein A2W24_00710 [Microgenomates group bacterium RBG_16_45_19]